MVDAYRVPDRGVDETDVARAKIHEAGETKRKLIEEREETKRVRAKEWGVAPFMFGGVSVALLCGAGALVSSFYFDTKNVGACKEKASSFATLQCDHPLHVLLTRENGEKVCKCGVPKLP